MLFKISKDEALSIKRVLTTNSFIVKTGEGGVKILTIEDLETKKFSLKLLLEAKDPWNSTESLNLKISPSGIVIATTQNERVDVFTNKRSVKVMKI
jgi:hypothetical protein